MQNVRQIGVHWWNWNREQRHWPRCFGCSVHSALTVDVFNVLMLMPMMAIIRIDSWNTETDGKANRTTTPSEFGQWREVLFTCAERCSFVKHIRLFQSFQFGALLMRALYPQPSKWYFHCPRCSIVNSIESHHGWMAYKTCAKFNFSIVCRVFIVRIYTYSF